MPELSSPPEGLLPQESPIEASTCHDLLGKLRTTRMAGYGTIEVWIPCIYQCGETLGSTHCTLDALRGIRMTILELETSS